jgi:hypothetical protein
MGELAPSWERLSGLAVYPLSAAPVKGLTREGVEICEEGGPNRFEFLRFLPKADFAMSEID